MTVFGGGVVRLPREARRPSPIFLGVVALFVLTGALLWVANGGIGLLVLLFVLSGWVVSLCLHEFAHAYTGYRAGDTSVAARGYLTLDPRRYAHPVLSIVVPLIFVLLGGFGLPGGAVWIDHAAIRNRVRDTLISLAGPAANLLFLLVLLLPFWAGAAGYAHAPFWGALAFLAFLQLTATVLNLVPLPGLDGGNALQPWLNYEWRRGYAMMAPYGLIAIFVLLMTGTINRAFFMAVYRIGDLLGLPAFFLATGQAEFPSLSGLLR